MTTAPTAASPLVFITGASSGLGLALADEYWRLGWRVALVARKAEVLQAWAAGKGAAAGDGRVGIYPADVRDAKAMLNAAQACVAAQGWPEVVIANAGISHGIDTAVFEDIAVMKNIFDTNLFGVVHTFHPFVQAFCERGHGKLVAVASVAGVRGLPGHGAYCSSKAAVISYAESLRGECRKDGVQVVTLLPGYIDTPLTRDNPFPMPFLTSPEVFARKTVQAIARGDARRTTPWPMGVVAWLLARLPCALLDWGLRNQPRKLRQSASVPGVDAALIASSGDAPTKHDSLR